MRSPPGEKSGSPAELYDARGDPIGTRMLFVRSRAKRRNFHASCQRALFRRPTDISSDGGLLLAGNYAIDPG
jgi:hypothetical protein